VTRVRASALLDKLSGGVVPIGDDVDASGFHDAHAWARAQRDGGISFAPMVDRAALAAGDVDLLTKAGEDAARLGVGHAIVDLGGTVVRLDVHKRRVEAQITAHGDVVERGIDAYIRPYREPEPVVHDEDSEGAKSAGDEDEPELPVVLPGAPGPARVVRNRSLAVALAGFVDAER